VPLSINIPDRFLPGFKALTELPEETAEQLLQGLAKPGEYINLESLASLMGPEVQLEKDLLRNILQMLASLNVQEEQLKNASSEQIAEALVGDCKAKKIQGKGYDWDHLKNFLLKYLLLEPNALRTISQAALASNDRERILVGAEILTDIRPINLHGKLHRSIILQTLKIQYLDKTTEDSSEAYFALDPKDLRKLRDQIDSALKTESELTDILKNTNLSALQYFEE
jgi:hypothetical protein